MGSFTPSKWAKDPANLSLNEGKHSSKEERKKERKERKFIHTQWCQLYKTTGRQRRQNSRLKH